MAPLIVGIVFILVGSAFFLFSRETLLRMRRFNPGSERLSEEAYLASGKMGAIGAIFAGCCLCIYWARQVTG